MARLDGRSVDQLRPIKFLPNPQKDPAGSVLIEWGDTKVICSATVEEKVPKWMKKDDATGWITCEY
jgi:ribonuclease PH